MNTRKGQLTKSNQIHTSLSGFETNKLAQSCRSKREISGKTNNSIKQSGVDSGSVQTKDNTPRIEVTVDFAAKQLFQILLIDIKRRNSKFDSILEPLPGAFCV